MRIDHATMLFVDLTDQEALELQAFAESVVLHGNIPNPQPEWVDQWMREFGYDERQRLLVISTAFPQRVLLSVARYQSALIDGTCGCI